MVEMTIRDHVPCVAAYTIIEAMIQRLASSKLASTIQFIHDQENRSRHMTLTMINDPSG